MTESEAKQKWCPMVRDISLKGASLDISSAFCKGGACMMWRNTEPMPMVETYEGKTVREFTEATGYCGLAGK